MINTYEGKKVILIPSSLGEETLSWYRDQESPILTVQEINMKDRHVHIAECPYRIDLYAIRPIDFFIEVPMFRVNINLSKQELMIQKEVDIDVVNSCLTTEDALDIFDEVVFSIEKDSIPGFDSINLYDLDADMDAEMLNAVVSDYFDEELRENDLYYELNPMMLLCEICGKPILEHADIVVSYSGTIWHKECKQFIIYRRYIESGEMILW